MNDFDFLLQSDDADIEYAVSMSYDHMNQLGLDLGFCSEIHNGKDYHKVTRPIVLSCQKFQKGTLINQMFSNGKDFRIRLADRSIIPYYSDYIEIRYVIRGYLELEIEGETASFQENEICFINSSAYHCESIQNSDCTILNISIDRNFFNEGFLTRISLSPLQKFLRSNILHLGHTEKYLHFSPISTDTVEIQNDLFSIFNEVRLQKPGYLEISRGYIIRLMDNLATGYKYNFQTNEKIVYYDTLFQSVSDYMRQHMNSISKQDLSDQFHFQANFFNHLIRKYTGKTYSQYLISLRIERAKELLETTDFSINEIIWIVGYQNKGFFYRQFESATGMKPLAFRRANSGLKSE